jgi:serine/threonine-protein kinase RsbW
MLPRDADHGAPPAAGAADAPPVACSFRLPAALAAAWAARNRIRAWLTAHRFPDDVVDDVEYLVSEAVSNSAEHAYAGQDDGVVEVDAAVEPAGPGLRQVRVAVRDRGRWRPVDPDPGHRGHGIAAMAALAQEVTIRRRPAPGGTEVVLLSPPSAEPATARPPVRA